jgi:hypothetical protein
MPNDFLSENLGAPATEIDTADLALLQDRVELMSTYNEAVGPPCDAISVVHAAFINGAMGPVEMSAFVRVCKRLIAAARERDAVSARRSIAHREGWPGVAVRDSGDVTAGASPLSLAQAGHAPDCSLFVAAVFLLCACSGPEQKHLLELASVEPSDRRRKQANAASLPRGQSNVRPCRAHHR